MQSLANSPIRYPLPAVAGLICGPSGKLLLVQTHKWSGLWGVPGGKIEYGEKAEQALRREMCEEVGLELSWLEFAFVAELIEDKDFYKPAHFISLEYLAKSKTENVIVNEEIKAFQWLSLNEALVQPINSYTLQLLQFAQRHKSFLAVTHE